MLGSEMIVKVKAKLNSLDTGSNRTVRPEMALLFLNDSYLKLSRAKYKASSGIVDDTAFQANQQVTDELNHLTTSSYITPVISSDPEPVYSADLTTLTRYRYHLRSKINIGYKGKTKWVTDINYHTLNTSNPATLDPFNRPEPLNPTVYFEGNKLLIPAKDFTVPNYYVTYMQFPETITQVSNCIAPFIDEIVDVAAFLILESWGDPRAQTLLTAYKVVSGE